DAAAGEPRTHVRIVEIITRDLHGTGDTVHFDQCAPFGDCLSIAVRAIPTPAPALNVPIVKHRTRDVSGDLDRFGDSCHRNRDVGVPFPVRVGTWLATPP